MAVTSDRNRVREGLIDSVLRSVLNSETIYISKSSVKPKVIRDGRIVDSGDSYSPDERRVLYSKDFKSIVGFAGDFIVIYMKMVRLKM